MSHCKISSSFQPMLPISCWSPTSFQLLKVLRASLLPPQRKWGLCKLSPWVGKTPMFSLHDVCIFRTFLFFFYHYPYLVYTNITLAKFASHSTEHWTAWMNDCWSSCAVAVRYSGRAGTCRRQRCLRSSRCRVCSAGPQPHRHHRWPRLETLHVCNSVCVNVSEYLLDTFFVHSI